MALLEKVRRLERYVQLTDGQVDDVLESTLDKMLERERQRLLRQQARLEAQIADFEARYGWNSEEFYHRFERGELGDDTDFVEWSATIEMLRDLQRTIDLLGGESTE
ncbi:MAG TPA: hypothetical protein ENK08_02870 [Chloroflexi bacterium]|nr:hypothetical protein [Chloroflexota bacterium]